MLTTYDTTTQTMTITHSTGRVDKLTLAALENLCAEMVAVRDSISQHIARLDADIASLKKGV